MSQSLKQRLGELTRPTGEEDLMAVDYPSPRVRIAPKHAVIVGLVIVLIAGIWWWATRSSAPPDAAGESTVYNSAAFASDDALSASASDISLSQSTPTSAVAASSASPPEEIVVSVVGLVERPGIMTLAPGARVADALAQARAFPEADLRRINHAEVLEDGQQVLVVATDDPEPAPVPGPGSVAGGATSGNSDAATVNINTATAAELTKLHGVGEATAAAIIDYRDTVGKFDSIEQLVEVSGIGPAKLTAIADQATV